MAARAAAEVIDAHVHVWDRGRFSYPWIAAGSPLDRDVLPGELRQVVAGQPVVGGLLVEAANTPAEIPWLLLCAAQLPGQWGVIGSLPLDAADAPEQIARWAADPRFRGVRLNWFEPRPETAPLRPAMDALARAGLALDLLCNPEYLPEISRFARDHADVSIVLNHFGGAQPGRDSLAALEPFSRLETVRVKVSGFSCGADQLRAALTRLDELFGPGRMLFGSNYPLCLSRGAYAEVLALALEAAGIWDEAWRAQLFTRTACSVYRLQSSPEQETSPS
jgi:L-fuconolactonase